MLANFYSKKCSRTNDQKIELMMLKYEDITCKININTSLCTFCDVIMLWLVKFNVPIIVMDTYAYENKIIITTYDNNNNEIVMTIKTRIKIKIGVTLTVII